MQTDNFQWIILEPYVQVACVNNDVLYYNTVNRKYIACHGNFRIAEITRQLIDPANGYVTKIGWEELKKNGVEEFIAGLQNDFMAGIQSPGLSLTKPFNIVPQPIVKQDKFALENHLREITFHVSATNWPGMAAFDRAYTQFPFPLYSAGPGEEFSLETIMSVIRQTTTLPFATFNFTGPGILDSPWYDSIGKMMADTPFRRKFHMPLSLLPPTLPGKLKRNESLCIYVTFPAGQQEMDQMTALVKKYGKQKGLEFNFVVRSNAEVEESIGMISGLNTKHVYFKPHLDGHNTGFFREQVFIGEADIKASRPTRNQVFSRMTMNENDYGKLTIFPDGAVFANVNDAPLGNIHRESVAELVAKEVEGGTSWKRRRLGVEPCKNCLYQFLCPPISNYEISSKKFNFCHVCP